MKVDFKQKTVDESVDNKIILSQLAERNEDDSDKFILISYILDLSRYLRIRSRQFFLFLYAGFLSLGGILGTLKNWSVQRMYWGRSSLYRTFFHIVVFSITLVSLLVGITSRINILDGESGRQGLVLASGVVGNSDTLYQAGTTETITASNPYEKNWPEYKHIVKRDETLDSIAAQYGVSTATIKWANNLYSDRLRIDQELSIPGLDGVLYEVKSGDTVESIVNSSSIQNANAFDIIELNQLEPPDYTLAEGQRIFIPNAIKIIKKSVTASTSGTYVRFADPGIEVAPGTFVNPLLYCPGYYISRGLLPWHTGVDMAKAGGCWINATADGTVVHAEWGSYGQGFYVQVDHHNGFVSYYYHGNGEFAVSRGQTIKAGQRILYMGCTGNCTGTHLHFEVRYNGSVVDPMNYMKL